MVDGDATTAIVEAHYDAEQEPRRRDFLTLVTLATAAVGVGAVAWTFIDSMNPAEDTLAAGAPLEVDLSKIAPGQQIVVLWRGKPIFVLNRTPEALKELQAPDSAVASQRPEFECSSTAAVCGELAPVDDAGVSGFSSASARISAACLAIIRSRTRAIRLPTGRAAISARATARNMISRGASTAACRRRTICRCRRIRFSTARRSALAKTRPA